VSVELLLKAIQDAVGLGLKEETAVRLFCNKLYHLEPKMRVTFYFPDDAKLTPVEVKGNPPPIGATVYFSTLKRCEDPDYNYDEGDKRKWMVKQVDYSVTVEPDRTAALKTVTWGQEPNTYRAEVRLGWASDDDDHSAK
jgi:hypothetical protein